MTEAGASGQPRRVVAYVMSRFPKVTETFILYEMVAMEEAGSRVELFPLLREKTAVMHPAAREYVARACFLPFVSPAILSSNLRVLRKAPRRYLSTLAAVLRGTWGSLNFFVGGLGIFMKVVHASSELVERGVDHVHCHFASHPALAGFVIRRLTGIPFSFTAHGSDLHVDRHMLPQKVEEAAFVVAISEDNRRVILEECRGAFAEKIEVIHCGVDTQVFAPPPQAAHDSPFRIVCVGTLHEVKGQRYLVEAVAELVAAGLDVTCTFVGSGPDETALKDRARSLGIGERCTFTGSVEREVVARTLMAASAVCSPSVPTTSGKREGIPVVLMEAMAAARPVVASRLSGIPELVDDGENGLLVPPGDAQALAEALRRLYDDESLRERLGAAARRRVLEDFDVAVNARKLLERIERANRVDEAA